MSIKEYFQNIRVREVLELENLRLGWDSYEAPPPNKAAIANTLRILRLCDYEMLREAKIMASAEGGVGICFVRGERYADLECSNDGDVLGVRYVGRQMPIIIETTGQRTIVTALQEIKAHIG